VQLKNVELCRLVVETEVRDWVRKHFEDWRILDELGFVRTYFY